MNLHISVWICMDLYGAKGIYIQLYGAVWSCMELNESTYSCIELKSNFSNVSGVKLAANWYPSRGHTFILSSDKKINQKILILISHRLSILIKLYTHVSRSQIYQGLTPGRVEGLELKERQINTGCINARIIAFAYSFKNT